MAMNGDSARGKVRESGSRAPSPLISYDDRDVVRAIGASHYGTQALLWSSVCPDHEAAGIRLFLYDVVEIETYSNRDIYGESRRYPHVVPNNHGERRDQSSNHAKLKRRKGSQMMFLSTYFIVRVHLAIDHSLSAKFWRTTNIQIFVKQRLSLAKATGTSESPRDTARTTSRPRALGISVALGGLDINGTSRTVEVKSIRNTRGDIE